jgi:type I restriction enzyme S subunit
VRISVPVPPIDEQRAIASYLDAETARIDELIDEKQRLSDVLAELRASVMGEAIQRGLRPDAKVVESGVPWLGDVPAHWRVLRLKHLLDGIEQGWSPQCDSRQAEDHEWGVLKAGACNGGVFHPEEQKALQAGMAADPSIEVKPGDVLMSRASGSLDLVGSVAHVDDVRPGLMLSDKIFRLKIDESQGTSSKWLAMTFNTPAQRRQIASHVGGAEGLARNITSSAIMELWLAVPPPEEQMAIVEHVTGRVAHIDELTKAVGAEIALLQELRSATITDAVLGRIDVREHMKH